MTEVQSRSRRPSRLRRWWSSWCCVSAGSARCRCRFGASTRHARPPGSPPAAMTAPRPTPRAASRPGAPQSTCVATADWSSPRSVPAPRCRGSPSRPRRPPLSNRACDDRGSASLLAVALIAILLAFTTGAAYLGAAVIARHRAQAAADLAALAAAGAVAGGPEAACARASQIASAMRTTVAACRVDGLDVVLDVQVRVSLGRFGTGSARAVARAGPVET